METKKQLTAIKEGNFWIQGHRSLSKQEYQFLLEQAELAQKLARFKEYFDELYGDGLEIAYWHENGDLELFDNFYDAAIEYMEEESQ